MRLSDTSYRCRTLAVYGFTRSSVAMLEFRS